MLGYQSTSFHDAHYLRQLLGREPAPEFARWLERMKIQDTHNRLRPVTAGHPLLAHDGIRPDPA
jgi:ethanolamine ammonia-lyase large subunit